jgi:heat-inducible transcriptional repressor
MANRASTLPTQADWTPDARGQAVLAAIIREHLRTGEPVGSRTISERFASGASWSAATIRNVMAELEDHGLVEQPHTSAGRVPTDKGYRFYVDHSIGDARLSKADLSAIDRTLGLNADGGAQPGRLMEKVSHLLSELSENVGIVVSPPVADSRLEHIEFLQLADERILVVLVFSSNVIQNKIIRVDERLTQEELERAARYLNTEFSGKSLQTIRAEILSMMGEEKALYDRLLRNAVLLFERSVEGDEAETTGDVYIDGASNILAKPDFSDVARLRELFRTFEAKSRLVKILNECIAREPVFGDVHVVIGREHSAPSLQSCALITAPYRLGEGFVAGSIGVVGPMRIEYARTIAAVNYIARLVERMLRDEPRI